MFKSPTVIKNHTVISNATLTTAIRVIVQIRKRAAAVAPVRDYLFLQDKPVMLAPIDNLMYVPHSFASSTFCFMVLIFGQSAVATYASKLAVPVVV